VIVLFVLLINSNNMSSFFFLTGSSRVCNDDPKIDRLFSSEFFVIPTFLHPDRSVRLDRDPRVLIPNLEGLVLRFLLQLKRDLPFRLSVGFGELDPFRRPNSSSDSTLLSNDGSARVEVGVGRVGVVGDQLDDRGEVLLSLF
jgi:hypothetical protein